MGNILYNTLKALNKTKVYGFNIFESFKVMEIFAKGLFYKIEGIQQPKP